MRQLTLGPMWCPKRKRQDELERSQRKLAKIQYDELAKDVIAYVFTFLGINELCKAKAVCRSWYSYLHECNASYNTTTIASAKKTAFRLNCNPFYQVNSLIELKFAKNAMLESIHEFQIQALRKWGNEITAQYQQYFKIPICVKSYTYSKEIHDDEPNVGFVAQDEGYPVKITLGFGDETLEIKYFSDYKRFSVTCRFIEDMNWGEEMDDFYTIFVDDETSLTLGEWMEFLMRLFFFENWEKILRFPGVKTALETKAQMDKIHPFLVIFDTENIRWKIREFYPTYFNREWQTY